MSHRLFLALFQNVSIEEFKYKVVIGLTEKHETGRNVTIGRITTEKRRTVHANFPWMMVHLWTNYGEMSFEFLKSFLGNVSLSISLSLSLSASRSLSLSLSVLDSLAPFPQRCSALGPEEARLLFPCPFPAPWETHSPHGSMTSRETPLYVLSNCIPTVIILILTLQIEEKSR